MATFIWYAEAKKQQQSCYYNQLLRTKVQASMPQVTIQRVDEVADNKFLHAAFQIKKAEFYAKYRAHCPTEELFHATAACNVSSILETNLNWRKVTRSKYGIGVSFSDNPNYANKYCNNKNGPNRALIVCEVLIGIEKKVSDNHHLFPKNNVDSYRSVTKRVVVKFEDNTFYPKYVVYYNTSGSNYVYRSPDYHDYDDDDYDLLNVMDRFNSMDLYYY